MKLCPICHRCYEDADTVCVEPGHEQLIASRPGRPLITEKYRLDRLLGRGGMGAVYAGTHVELDRPVAIKLLLPQLLADAQALERFRREARAAARINHPNVAGVYDFGVLPDDEAYLVMELVEGQTLREFMNAFHQFPFEQAVGIAEQVADGIEAAHRQDIIHRDLKPSNIILNFNQHDERWVAKVVDFGIAKLREHGLTNEGGLTASGAFIGTPRYMSPEQCMGYELDARSDIYSLGIILYEMLAGAPPFDAPTAMAVALKHVGEPPPAVEKVRRRTPAALVALVTEMIQKNPATRPQSSSDVAHRLREIASSAELRQADEQEGETNTFAEPDKPMGTSAASSSAPPSEVVAAINSPQDEARQTLQSNWLTVHEPAEAVASLAEHNSAVSESQAEEFIPSVLQPGDGETVTRVVPPKRLPTSVGAREPDKPVTTSHQILPAASGAKNTGQRNLSPLVYAAAAFIIVFGIGLAWLALHRSTPQTPEAKPAPQTEATTRPEATINQRATTTNLPVNPVATELPATEADNASLKTALDDWVQATNQKDLKKQMDLYMPRLSAFYLSRNVTRADVQAEKARLYQNGGSVKVTVSDVQTVLTRSGRFALMRFRKQYEIGSDAASKRSGEVVQELKWEKTSAGWKITSERDARVLR